MRITNFTILFILAGLLLQVANVNAIPAFARKYRMSCKTCHLPIPRLKPYGDDFAGDGFRLKDKDSPRYYMESGDEHLSLIRDLPFAVRMDAFATYNMNNNESLDFGSPYLIKLLSGGELSDRFSYYFYAYLNERGEVAGVEDAYLMYNDFFGIDLDVMVGQFQVSDPLFKRELRLTLEDYEIYKRAPGFSDVRLSYDRGIMTTLSLPTGTGFIFEVVNGNGIPEADAAHFFDKDKYKSFAGRLTQDIGGFLRIGGFGYYGQEVTDLYNLDIGSLTNEVMYYGPDLTISAGNVAELNVQYLYRKDEIDQDDYYLDKDTQGGMAEIIITPAGDESRWYFVALGNWIDSDAEELDYTSATLHAGYLLKRNLRIGTEYTHVFTEGEPEYGKVSLGFVAAF